MAGLLPLPAPASAPARARGSAAAAGGSSPRKRPATAVAGLTLLPPLGRAWLARGGRVAACSQTSSLDVLLRDLAVGTMRLARWEPLTGLHPRPALWPAFEKMRSADAASLSVLLRGLAVGATRSARDHLLTGAAHRAPSPAP